MNTLKTLVLWGLIVLASGSAACHKTEEPGGAVTAKGERQGKLRIVTTIAPLYSYTKNIAGDTADVDNLLPSGAGPHEYAFSPSDIRKLTGAQVIIKNGAGLESWLGKLIGPAGELSKSAQEKPVIIDTSGGVEIIDNDPHIWLSPGNAIIQVQNIRDGLIKADPGNAEAYRDNAGVYIKQLEGLDNEIRNEIRTWKGRKFIAFHSAFRYFTRDYGLTQAAVIQETPEMEASPRHIAEVIDIIKSTGIRAIFTEPQGSHKIVRSIAGDLDLQVYSLDTMETGLLSKEWYVDTMRANVMELKKALN